MVLSCLCVEGLWSHVEASGPDDRPDLVVHTYLREALGITQLREHSLPLAVVERHVSDGSVLEQQAQLVVASDDADNVYQWW